MMEVEIESDYKKQEEDLKKSIKKIAKDSGSEVAKKLEKRESKDYWQCKRICRMLLDETMDMYESGSETWETLVDDLCAALKQVEK